MAFQNSANINQAGLVLASSSGSFTGVTYVAANTWTPSWKFGGANTGLGYSFRVGAYTRIGDAVFFNIGIQLSGKGTSTGTATIDDWPVSTGGNGQYQALPITWYGLFSLTANYTDVAIQPGNSTTSFTLYQSGQNQTPAIIDDTHCNTNTKIITAGVYLLT